MLRRLLLWVPLLALTLAGCDTFGPIPEDEPLIPPETTEPADELEAELRARGRELAPYMILEEEAMRGELPSEGATRDFGRLLRPGWCYKVIGLGGEGVEDLDVRVYEPGGGLVQRDVGTDREAYLGQMRPICPNEAATYRVQIRAATGQGPFVVQLYRSL